MSSSLSEENMSWGITRLLHPELSLPICFWFDLPRKQSLWPPGSSEILHNGRVLISEDVLDLLSICQNQLETVSLASKLRPWCLHVLSRKMKWRNWIIFFMQNLTFAYRSKEQMQAMWGAAYKAPPPLVWVGPAGLQTSQRWVAQVHAVNRRVDPEDSQAGFNCVDVRRFLSFQN